jgi:hypothetical protein
MHQGNRPRKLEDISHLFLSASESKKRDSRKATTVVVHLVAPPGEPWRAFFSAGLASALTTLGIDVELVETGDSLPNSAYYFGVDPSGYLRPVLDPDAVVSLTVGPSLRFRYAAHPRLLGPPAGESPVPGRARIVLIAFEAGMQPPGGSPSALVLIALPNDIEAVERIEKEFMDRCPGSPIWRISPGEEVLPDSLPADIARRSPPASVFFHDLASAMVQRLGSAGGGKD